VPEDWKERVARAAQATLGRWSARLAGRPAPYY